MNAVYTRGRQAWRYAQQKGGQQLHLVEVYGSGEVDEVAVCGRRGPWRMTINMPLGHACGNCCRVWRARK